MKQIFIWLPFVLVPFVMATACSSSGKNPPPATTEATVPATLTATVSATPSPALPTEQPLPFSVSSSGIVNGMIQDAYGTRAEQTQKGVPSRSFPLTFSGVPEDAAYLALAMIDPDGGNWVHWLAVNLPVTGLPENASIDLAADLIQGKNDFGFTGYGGPTPPSGTHTYIVTVYALSKSVTLENGFSLEEFHQAIDDKVLETAEIRGDYSH